MTTAAGAATAWTAAARHGARYPALLACATLAVAWLVTLVLHPWSDESVGDLGVRRQFATLFLDGALPYRDVPFEYPPLAAPLMALPGLLGTGEDGYWAGFAAVNLVLAVAVLLLTGRLATATGGDPRKAMLGVAAAPLLLGAIVRLHFDLAATALTAAALVAILSRRSALGFALIGLGTMTKAFPLVLAPIALSWLLAQGERRAALRGAAALAATLAVVAGGAVALSPAGALAAARYQTERPLQIESTPAIALLTIERLGGDPVRTVPGYGSTGVSHPLDDAVGAAFLAALGGALAGLTLLAARRARDRREGADAFGSGRALVLASFAAVAAVAALGKVLSPQFLLWIVPLPALAWAWRMRALAATSAVAMALTLVEFPSRYVDLIAGETVAVGVTALRDLALIVTVALATVELTRRHRAAEEPARRSALARPLPRR